MSMSGSRFPLGFFRLQDEDAVYFTIGILQKFRFAGVIGGAN